MGGDEEVDQHRTVGAAAEKKRKMDSLWADMNGTIGGGGGGGDDAGTVVDGKNKRRQVDGGGSKSKKSKKTKREKKAEKMLAQIFGSASAKQICSGGRGIGGGKKNRDGGGRTKPLREKGRVTVTETKTFAGKSLTVSKTVDAEAVTKKKKSTGVDSVLAALEAPKSVNTVEKSSMDWDQFKDKEGVNDELNQAARNGFLERQDFLQRCDERKFEQEKTERNEKRRKEGR
jgi:hypothetical protein